MKLYEKEISYIEALKSIKCKVRQGPVNAEPVVGCESFVNSFPSVIAGEIDESETVDVGGLRVVVEGPAKDYVAKAI
jgi:hypothetical protein